MGFVYQDLHLSTKVRSCAFDSVYSIYGRLHDFDSKMRGGRRMLGYGWAFTAYNAEPMHPGLWQFGPK